MFEQFEQMRQIKAINQQLLYRHKMVIYRLIKVKQPDCSTSSQWAAISKPIPCKLSYKTPDKGSDIREDVNPLDEGFTIFCPPEVEVKAGDLLEIDGIKYRAGNPFRYPAHQEINAARSDLA